MALYRHRENDKIPFKFPRFKIATSLVIVTRFQNVCRISPESANTPKYPFTNMISPSIYQPQQSFFSFFHSVIFSPCSLSLFPCINVFSLLVFHHSLLVDGVDTGCNSAKSNIEKTAYKRSLMNASKHLKWGSLHHEF